MSSKEIDSDVGYASSVNEHIDIIADKLGVSIDFLIRGEDLKTNSLSHQEYELIENFHKLSEKGKEVVSADTKKLSEKND